ncbi:MAG TPA: RsmB/NOP family class I SAM-dependent RNA methyltransferase, partial [Hellea balneolensis]|nr:RsmB/NOP family class I SAM-dependent RNA methyltransferase [Hellea balneolensis]
ADIVCADATRWQDPSGAGFDIVLLDAPCSATGTFRRRPDVLATKTPEDVASLVRLQQKLLLAAARNVRPGGTLLYCTCSLEPAEGEAQKQFFLQNRSDFRLNSLLSTHCPEGQEGEQTDGCFRILPHFMKEKGGQDGFFIAAFTRC